MSLFQIIILVILILIFLETTIILITNSTREFKIASHKKVFLDTSALMDGRILNIAEINFIGYDLIIPRSVLRELQLIADGKDNERRNRARLGLDVASGLQKLPGITVKIYEDKLSRGEYVDEKLLEYAKKTGGYICTTDFNLNKVATTEGITVLNINDLALVMKSQYLPGERVRVKITSTGSNPNQGVGHLQDGTMVIVDRAAKRVNTEIDVDILKYIQTSAGRMIFAKVSDRQSHPTSRHKKK